MACILELPEVRQRISPISVDEYHRFGERNMRGKRTELLRGIVVEKPRKTPWHSFIVQSMAQEAMRMVPSGFSCRIHDPLTFRDSEPEPDLAVVRGTDVDFSEKHPSTAALVIEVTCGEGALERELALLYAEAAVDEYWIILGNDKLVEVYRRPIEGVYQDKTTASLDETLACASVPGFTIPFLSLLSKGH